MLRNEISDNVEGHTYFEKMVQLDPQTGEDIYDAANEIAKNKNDVEQIYETYKKIYNRALKHAKKFYAAFDAKNPIIELSLEELMRRAKKYKVKYNLTDNEFILFIKFVKEKRSEKITNEGVDFINVPMSRALGYERQRAHLNINPGEEEIVNEIKKLDANNFELSRRVKLQSYSYTKEKMIQAVNGTYDPKTDDKYSAINPVIAALFIPKIEYFENRIVLADVANMITRLAKGQAITDPATNELYNDLIHDPARNSEAYKLTPMKDLSLRAQIQTCMWDIIMNLRNGKYYVPNFTRRLDSLLNKYPSNTYDNSDVNMAVDSGAWLRKLMNAFSLRPTVVGRTKYHSPAYQVYKAITSKPEMVDLSEFVEKEELEDITYIPMIVVRLPPRNLKNVEGHDSIKQIHISADVGQLSWYKNENAPTIYNHKIISSNGVLIFYINRTYSTINYVSPYIDRFGKNRNVIYDKLPPSISGATNLNTIEISFDESINIDNSIYTLKSVVCYESMEVKLTDEQTINIAIGQSAVINITDNLTTTHVWYNPYLTEPDANDRIRPMSTLVEGGKDYSYTDYLSRYGSIFIYVNENY